MTLSKIGVETTLHLPERACLRKALLRTDGLRGDCADAHELGAVEKAVELPPEIARFMTPVLLQPSASPPMSWSPGVLLPQPLASSGTHLQDADHHSVPDDRLGEWSVDEDDHRSPEERRIHLPSLVVQSTALETDVWQTTDVCQQRRLSTQNSLSLVTRSRSANLLPVVSLKDAVNGNVGLVGVPASLGDGGLTEEDHPSVFLSLELPEPPAWYRVLESLACCFPWLAVRSSRRSRRHNIVPSETGTRRGSLSQESSHDLAPPIMAEPSDTMSVLNDVVHFDVWQEEESEGADDCLFDENPQIDVTHFSACQDALYSAALSSDSEDPPWKDVANHAVDGDGLDDIEGLCLAHLLLETLSDWNGETRNCQGESPVAPDVDLPWDTVFLSRFHGRASADVYSEYHKKIQDFREALVLNASEPDCLEEDTSDAVLIRYLLSSERAVGSTEEALASFLRGRQVSRCWGEAVAKARANTALSQHDVVRQHLDCRLDTRSEPPVLVVRPSHNISELMDACTNREVAEWLVWVAARAWHMMLSRERNTTTFRFLVRSLEFDETSSTRCEDPRFFVAANMAAQHCEDLFPCSNVRNVSLETKSFHLGESPTQSNASSSVSTSLPSWVTSAEDDIFFNDVRHRTMSPVSALLALAQGAAPACLPGRRGCNQPCHEQVVEYVPDSFAETDVPFQSAEGGVLMAFCALREEA